MQKIFAANWKMYKTRAQAAQSASDLAKGLVHMPAGQDVVVFAPFTSISCVADAFKGVAALSAGGQNCYPAEEGAFTGETSPAMLLDAGASWVLTGHSERRHIMGEDDVLVARKTIFALEHGLKVLFCIGETLDEREAGKLNAVLERQLAAGFSGHARGPSRALPLWASLHWLRACVGHWHRQGCRAGRSARCPRGHTGLAEKTCG